MVMLKSIFLLAVAIVILYIFAPVVFIMQTVLTITRGISQGGIKKAWNDTAKYFLDVATDGVDQLGATILYRVKDLTISSYTFILCKHGKMCWFRKFIDAIFGKKHCQTSAINELDEMRKSIETIKKAMT